MLKSLRVALCACIIAPLAAIGAAPDAPDIILVNGHIFTGVKDRLHAEALAIRGERIDAVGTSAAIAKLASSKTQRIDLKGATVIPGINDAHNPLDIGPRDSIEVDMHGRNPSWGE